MPNTATVEQFELIKDDARKEVAHVGPIAFLRAIKLEREKHGELVTRAMAAEILGVSVAQIAVWCSRERLTSIEIGPMKLIPGNEVLVLYQQRKDGELPLGGRGHKQPSLASYLRGATKLRGQE